MVRSTWVSWWQSIPVRCNFLLWWVWFSLCRPYSPIESCLVFITIYSDFCGSFPFTLISGNKYIFVMYEYNNNSILVLAMKNMTDSKIYRVFERKILFFNKQGFKSNLHFLDNEASTALRTTIEDNKIEYQWLLLGNKRKNNTERVFQISKNHFILGFFIVNRNYLVALWDYNIHQAKITLNLLHILRIHNHRLAYQRLRGTFDYNKTSICPPEHKVVAHISTEKWASWRLWGAKRWYIRPALEYYWCHWVYITEKNPQGSMTQWNFFHMHLTCQKFTSRTCVAWSTITNKHPT